MSSLVLLGEAQCKRLVLKALGGATLNNPSHIR